MNRLQELHEHGQSIWLDYINREMLQSGELAELVDAGLRGVTSNPTIFEQAISSSDTYEDDLQRLAQGNHSAKEMFEELAVDDIRSAADLLRPVYDESGGTDGFVSLEVAPGLAYETVETISEARRLWSMVDRPNLMIKVPATEAGIPAIRTLIADGLNINVTLIFALERYEAVMDAYLSGLEDRHASGRPLDHVASVASFFVSRVDTNVDNALDDVGTPQASALKGKIAVANAKLAYQAFERTFSGERWRKLANGGAHVQRPLWASTSTKNPDYAELLYVDLLIGPHTVNTMPPKTLEAFRDHGTVARTVDQDVEEAQAALEKLAAVGVSLDEITDELEQEGVKKFADSYDELLEAIRQRRKELAGAT